MKHFLRALCDCGQVALGWAYPDIPILKNSVCVVERRWVEAWQLSQCSCMLMSARTGQSAVQGQNHHKCTIHCLNFAVAVLPVFLQFTAPALHTPAATSSTFSSVFKPFSSGKAGPITTPGRFGSSGSGSISSRSRRAVRSHGAQGTNRPKQQVLGQHSVSKLPKVATEADGGADESGEARKRRWR